MNNFEYIVSGLPVLSTDYRYSAGESFDETVESIRELLSGKDATVLDFLLKGFTPENLNEDFYLSALSSSDSFIREYFRFDLDMRNAKVRYLNRQLERAPEQDVLTLPGREEEEFPEASAVENVLDLTDLISRERGLDDVTWEKIDSLSTFHYFDLTAVLCFVAKLHIVDRWLSLDPESGKEFFRKLVAEVRGTFNGVKYNQ